MKRTLVTGSNKGIGLAIVTAILEQHDDTFVLLGSRDLERGRAARTALLRDHPDWSERIEVLELDVASDASVTAAAATVAARLEGEGSPLYGVVNNAGIGLGTSELAAVLEVNTLGVRRVCEAFLPLLRPSDGRIVNVTSASGPSFVATCSPERQRSFLDPSVTWPRLRAFIDECLALDGAEAFAAAGLGDGSPYGLSKACANTYTLLLAREHPNLRINACTPGYIETDLTRPYAEARGKDPRELGMKPPAEGTRAPMFLLFGEPEGNGRYYGSDALRSPLHRYRAPGSPPYTGE
ncbi:SDR family NAD(P)-dependent oxidoreductase [Paraliomyxa miuraensis]|uniref:SDR family NAD(P)-dependent oxidoreductase n=1 Tax=Paraliomyxa miuraensis TaxID=376150 RepID=UPI00224FC23F|nr:SDR family NAD(P)-dependent oxidoreductase [Paraliomyxa miuraensis]MCX4239542.1 SDR family NAD(P)-dependent oxidoreductase [Paraliomyxa miuraensis]